MVGSESETGADGDGVVATDSTVKTFRYVIALGVWILAILVRNFQPTHDCFESSRSVGRSDRIAIKSTEWSSGDAVSCFPLSILCSIGSPVFLIGHCADLGLLVPRAATPVQSPVPPPDVVVELGDRLLRKDASAERHGTDLNKHLELHRQTSVDRVARLVVE